MNEQELNKKIAKWLRPPPDFRVSEVHLPVHDHRIDRGRIGIEMQYTQEARDFIASEDLEVADVREVGAWQLLEWLPVFTRSFDDCVEHLLPKLRKDESYVDINLRDFHPEMGDPYWFTIRMMTGYPKMKAWQGGAETPALALCLAVEKLIDEEAK